MRQVVILADADSCIPDRIRADLGILTVPLQAAPFDPEESPQALRRTASPADPVEAAPALEIGRAHV